VSREADVTIIGGGIVGLATAWALTRSRQPRLRVLEAEPRLATHQTGHNSGVIHSGLYYRPGSLKAQNCVAGRDTLYRFCADYGIAFERCGKVVIATRPDELGALAELERRGTANGLRGLARLGPDAIREIEPAAAGIAGLACPETGIVDYPGVSDTLARLVRDAGASIETDTRVLACRRDGPVLVLETTRGPIATRALINCAGLQSDRVARACGVAPGLQIVPFRGEYYTLRPERQHLVRHLIYPVPDARFPFLGVHFTRMVQGGVEAGPNAVLALKREGYRWTDVSARDIATYSTFPGFWRMAARHWRTGFGEVWRSLSKPAFVQALRRLVPALENDDIQPAGSGVRAQAVEPSGALVDDFRIVEAERMIHVLNAPSPAATASLAIGRSIAERAIRHFDLTR
jgi:L-2-hydroxyglutarate oxidase